MATTHKAKAKRYLYKWMDSPVGRLKLVATDDVSRAGGQGVEQVVLLAGQHDLPLGAPHPAGRWVDANVLDLEHRQTVGRMAARRLKTGKLAPLARTGSDPGARAQRGLSDAVRRPVR